MPPSVPAQTGAVAVCTQCGFDPEAVPLAQLGPPRLFAALHVHTGEVLAEPIPGRNDSVNFCAFLDQLDAAIAPALGIHVVMNNGSSHRSKHTTGWFKDHPTQVDRPFHATARQLGEPDPNILLNPPTKR